LQHRKFDDVVPLLGLLCVHTPYFSCNPIHGNLRGVRSGDRSGQFCGPPRPIHLLVQVLRHVSTEMWDAPSSWKYICNRVFCRSNYL
jgi:hypothetical protein